jgi:ABC-type enterobactin transport system permease subunit
MPTTQRERDSAVAGLSDARLCRHLAWLDGVDEPLVVTLGTVGVIPCDLLARTVPSPVEIPVGLITALVGGPVFLWLLSRKTKSDA